MSGSGGVVIVVVVVVVVVVCSSGTMYRRRGGSKMASRDLCLRERTVRSGLGTYPRTGVVLST